LLKKVTKLLLILTLVLQIISASTTIVSANDNSNSEIEGGGLNEDIEAVELGVESTIPQASIDAMRAFIANNSADNPFVIPAGLSFNEAINALDWGEGITVWTPMGGHESPPGQLCGSIAFQLNVQVNEAGETTYDDEYGFWDICIYFIEAPENGPTIPQATIDAMYAFIANNSADNPFVIPSGLSFNEAINALGWGEGITVWTPMSGLELPPGQMCGSIALQLNFQVNEAGETTYDDEYGFWDICLYYAYEDPQTTDPSTSQPCSSQTTDPSTSQPSLPPPNLPQNGPNLPQTSAVLINTSLIGAGILATSGIVAYLKKKSKD